METSDPFAPAGTTDSDVMAVIDQFIEDRRQGKPVDEGDYLRKHPDIADALKRAFERFRSLESDVRAAREQSGPSPTVARCPFCHEPIDLAASNSLGLQQCSHCDKLFLLDAPSLQPPPELIDSGRFEPIECVGSGGFGHVWKAFDTRTDRYVAIKIPHRGQKSGQSPLLQEAKMAGRLPQHPHIVTVHDVGDDGSYIVSDFIEGETLADYLQRQRLTVAEVLDFGEKIAAALHHAHQHKVIHRDLKPLNVMLDDGRQPHVMDFGLAKTTDSVHVTVSDRTQVVGTFLYMSPEQAAGDSDKADSRSDVYSLGVMLFEMLTGELPFRGNVSVLLRKICSDDPPSLRSLDSMVPVDLNTIVLKCLEKDPDKRYQSAQELREELERVRTGHPIRARPVGRPARAWRWCRRNPGIAALLFVICLAISGIAGLSGQLYSSDHYREVQEIYTDVLSGDPSAVIGVIDRIRELARNPLADPKTLRHIAVTAFTTPVLASDSTTLRPQHHPDERCDAKTLAFVDDELVAVGFNDGTLRIFDAVTGQQTFAVQAHEGEWKLPKALRARRIAGQIELISVSKEGEVVRLRQDQRWQLERLGSCSISDKPLWSCRFSPNGEFLAVAESTGEVAAYSLPDCSRILFGKKPAKLIEQEFRGVAVSDSGRYVAAGYDTNESTGNGFLIWGKSSEIPIHHEPIDSGGTYSEGVCFLAERETILFGAQNSFVYDIPTRELLPIGAEHEIAGVATQPNGLWALLRSVGSVDLYDDALGRPIGNLPYIRDLRAGVRFSPSGELLAAFSANGVEIWSIQIDNKRVRTRGHDAPVDCVAISQREGLIASSDTSGIVRFWDDVTGMESTDPIELGRKVYCVTFDPLGRVVTVADSTDLKEKPEIQRGKQSVQLWARRGKQWESIASHDHEAATWATFDATGKHLAVSGSGIEILKLVEQGISQFKQVHRVEGPNNCKHIVFGPGNEHVSWISDWDKVKTLRWREPSAVPKSIGTTRFAGWQSLAVRPTQGELVFAASNEDRSAILGVWSVKTDEFHSITKPGIVQGSRLSISSDGRLLATLTRPNQIGLWDLEKGRKVLDFKHDEGGIASMTWSSDGSRLVVGTMKGDVYAWRMDRIQEAFHDLAIAWDE